MFFDQAAPLHRVARRKRDCMNLRQDEYLRQAAPDSLSTVGTVALNYRYFGCWNEVNARIAQRQNAVTVYVTLSSGLLAF